ncbi:MAG: hypothetical protein M1812_000033 [Candelaria pacifica]|nr:MAG: hypothetical protein M1812_000033 [Candelaria pacifica]
MAQRQSQSIAAQTQQGAENGHDSEWEYEYDDAETESVYVVLDFSSSGEILGPKGKPRKKSQPKVVDDADLNGNDSDRNGDRDGDRSASPSPFHPEESPEQQRIQILDLHTSKPIVSYLNRIYNCDWTDAIGTDLLLARPSIQSGSTRNEDLRSHPNYSLVATSAVKLLSTPAQLVAKQDIRVRQEDEIKDSTAFEGDQVINGNRDHTSIIASILYGESSSRPRQSQGGFLERLAAAKSAKGEQDEVTLVSKKLLTNTGWRAQQNQRRREETGGSSDHDTDLSRDEEDTVVEEGSTPRKRRRRSSEPTSDARGWTRGRMGKGRWHRADAGLIRAHQPELGDEPDADNRLFHTTTPKTLDQLKAPPPKPPSEGARAGATRDSPLMVPDENVNDAVTAHENLDGTVVQATPP